MKIEQSEILIVKHVSGSNAKFYIPSTLNIDLILRAVTRSENPVGLVVMGGDNVPTLVEIG